MSHLPKSVRVPIEQDNPSIMRNEELCIKCGQCRDICTDYIGVHDAYSLEDTGNRAVCINCGQCANVCPVSSITEKYEYEDVKRAIEDPDRIVIFNTSPSVRIALGEEFDLPDGSFVQGKMVALLRRLGGDYVLDTNFSADLTIVEEASELIERVTKNPGLLPQFTSCCPSWVKYAEIFHPDILDHISTSKSPIGMQGPTVKTYFARKMGLDPEKIVNVAVTPCTAKKFEIRREEMSAASKYLGIEGMRDMDYVITTRELAKWAKEAGIDFVGLEDSDFDSLMGEASGAGVIFGNTGGVMEAALRTAYQYITGQPAPKDFYDLKPVRGMDAVKEAEVVIGDLKLRAAVIYGTKAASEFIRQWKAGGKEYHFVEVMTCPGGCISGGGQPKGTLMKGDELRRKRIEGLYRRDDQMQLRNSHDNSEIKQLYEEFYGRPLSELAEKMLHTSYHDRSRELGGVYVCSVCGYIYDEAKGIPGSGIAPGTKWEDLPEGWVCPLCGASKAEFQFQSTASHRKSGAVKAEKKVKEMGAAEDRKELSALEISALCSNLAKGCEKQYKQEEAALFTELAGYFKAAAPAGEETDMSGLLSMVEKNLSEDFPAANAAAGEAKDRGALRALVWSEKVTRILKSILMRWEKEGDAMLENTGVYVCTICGFIYIGDVLPEVCPVCKVPNWKFEKIEGRQM